MERLLILEDDLALGEGVRLALQGDDRPVTLCRTLAQARQALEEAGPFALLILDGAKAVEAPGPEPGDHPQPGGPGGPGVDRWCRICGGECPVCHGEAAAGQAGGGPIQAPVSQNRLWDRVYLGGEVRWE